MGGDRKKGLDLIESLQFSKSGRAIKKSRALLSNFLSVSQHDYSQSEKVTAKELKRNEKKIGKQKVQEKSTNAFWCTRVSKEISKTEEDP